MPKAVFVQPDGSEKEIDVARMESLMRAAIRCNVDRLPPPDESEEDMLQFTAAERRPESRLSCQLRMTEALEGIRVTVPETQY